MTAVPTDPIVSHQCRFGDCVNCPEPMRCEHSCHLAHQPTTRWRRPATRRVWGRWT